MNASMSKRIPGTRPGKLEQDAGHLKKAAVVGAGIAAVVLLAAVPGVAGVVSGDNSGASSGPDIAQGDQLVSRASGTAVNISAGGSVPNAGSAYVAVNDGTVEKTMGATVPELPAVGGQRYVVGGALGQDAVATTTGLSAACAGVVGSNGQLQLGPDNTCLVNGDGQVRLALGSMPQLGLEQILGQLPELPELPGLPSIPGVPGLPGTGDLSADQLPDVQLQFVGSALTANCLQAPDGAIGRSAPVKGQIVAVVDGQRIPVAAVPQKGLSLDPNDVLSKVRQQLPAEAGAVVDQVLAAVPTNQLQNQRLVQLAVDERSVNNGRISVTALGVRSNLPGTAAKAEFGHVTCGPNQPDSPSEGPSSNVDVKASGGGAAEGTGDVAGTQVSGSGSVEGQARVSANESGVKSDGNVAANANVAPASNSSPMAPVGWATAAAILLTGIGIAGLRLLRSRRPAHVHHH